MQLESDAAKQQVITALDTAQKAQQSSQVAQFIAEMEREQAIVDSFRADNERETADDLRQTAEINARKFKAAAHRGDLLETIVHLSISGGDAQQTLKVLKDLQQIYVSDHNVAAQADLAVRIGDLCLNSPELESEEGLKSYKTVLEISKQRPPIIEPSRFVDIGDAIVGSDLDNIEAIPFYQHAIDLFSATKDINETIETRLKLAGVYEVEDPDAAEGLRREAINLGNSLTDPVKHGAALTVIARFYFDRNLVTEAKDYYTKADKAFRVDSSTSNFDALFGDAKALKGLADVSEKQNKNDPKTTIELLSRSIDRTERALAMSGVKDRDRSTADALMKQATARIRALTPKAIPITNVLLQTLRTDGIEAAVRKYHDLRTAKPDGYIFNESSINKLGYDLLEENRIREAIEIFKLNVDTFPDSYNTWDSLGDAYARNGNKDLAIKNYQESIKRNPNNLGGLEALKKLMAP